MAKSDYLHHMALKSCQGLDLPCGYVEMTAVHDGLGRLIDKTLTGACTSLSISCISSLAIGISQERKDGGENSG